MKKIEKLLALIGLSLALTVQAAPAVGDSVFSELRIESDRGLKRIPLPEGEWATLSVRTSDGTPKFGGSKANKFSQVILVKSKNGVMTHLLYVYVNTTSEVPRYTNELCKSKVNGRFSETHYISEVWDQACIQVYHGTEFLAVSTADKAPWSNVRSELRRRGISYPSSLLHIHYQRYNQSAQWLTYKLSVNPSTLGFADFDGKWANSPWHTDFLVRDPKRSAVMNSLLLQARGVQSILDWHFNNLTERSPNVAFPFELKGD
jgi:hypothetical protein